MLGEVEAERPVQVGGDLAGRGLVVEEALDDRRVAAKAAAGSAKSANAGTSVTPALSRSTDPE